MLTEQERDGHAAQIVTEAQRRYDAEKDAVKNGIAAQKGVIESAEDAYARFAEVGDWKEAAKAQRSMSEAASRITNLEAKQEFLETNKERLLAPPPKPERREVQPVVQQQDRLGVLVKDLQPAERVWLEKRPKFIDDAGYRNQVFGASQIATGRGYARGSEPYFREMEQILQEGETPRQTEPVRQVEQRERQERELSSDIAPQRRVSPGAEPRGSAREIKLTADEAEVADNLYGDPNSGADFIPNQADRYKKYFENKEKRRAQGRM